MSARFKTAGIPHNLVAGAEGGQEISNPIRYSYTINKINTVPETTLLEPNDEATIFGHGLHHLDRSYQVKERRHLFHRHR